MNLEDMKSDLANAYNVQEAVNTPIKKGFEFDVINILAVCAVIITISIACFVYFTYNGNIHLASSNNISCPATEIPACPACNCPAIPDCPTLTQNITFIVPNNLTLLMVNGS
jgi:hypothetical protein